MTHTASAHCPDCGDLTFEHTVETHGRYLRATLVDPEEWPEVKVYELDTAAERICPGCGYTLDDDEAKALREEAYDRFLRENESPRRSRR